eukprot:gene20150-22124_t
MAGASVKVAVRARPLNKREIENGAEIILSIEQQTVRIVNTKLKNELSLESHKIKNPFYMKEFKFNFSYWSVSENDPHFTNEDQIYGDLGADVVKSAFVGYNACIFAYGQTGAGKTYTMMGNNKKPGLIPQICENLFERSSSRSGEASYRVEISYMEIYNEQVRDLLRRNSPLKKQENLRVREHPKDGPFVQGVTIHPVTDFSQLEHLMDLGNAVRVTASTMMNNTSSRSHAIFTIKFTQAKFSENVPSETVSKINLVDLAGSERASASGATGLRLKEGGSINKSLTTLGTVISALAENSLAASQPNKTKKKTLFVPYRDSVLTWLLKDSIGGNSKTIMIAAVSPADINYGETLSTLRYASRAMNIVNKPVINEDPNVKLIRELRAEIERLRSLLQDDSQAPSLNKSISEAIEAKMVQDENKAEQLFQSWKHKWEQTRAICQEEQMTLKKQGRQTLLISEKPHFVGIDVDPLSSEIVIYRLEEGVTMIGSGDLTEEQGIALNGSAIEKEHCRINVSAGGESVYLEPVSHKCYVNNVNVEEERKLRQGDIVQFGDCLRFKFNNPKESAMLIEKRRSGNFSMELPVEFRRDRSLDSGLSCPDDLDACEPPDLCHQYEANSFAMASCPDLSIQVTTPNAIQNGQEATQLHTPLSRKNALNDNWLEVPNNNLMSSTPKKLHKSQPFGLDSSPIVDSTRRRNSLCDINVEEPHPSLDRLYSFDKKDFDDKREYVLDLIQTYRRREVDRIESDRKFKSVYDKDLAKLKTMKEQLEKTKKEKENKANDIEKSLDEFREKARVEKERKRREVERKIDLVVENLKKKVPQTAEINEELRKKKFQLRSKIEEFYKRMDLYENYLLGLESERRRHNSYSGDSEEVDAEACKGARRRAETVPVQNKDINTLVEQKEILEELLRRHRDALQVNADKIQRVKNKFSECKGQYATRIAHSHSLLKELQEHRALTSELLQNEHMTEDMITRPDPQVVHTLRYTDSTSSPLHIVQDLKDVNISETIFEYPENAFEAGVCAGATSLPVLENCGKHLPLKKTQSKSEKLVERKGKYEDLIRDAQKSIVELKSARTLEIDHYHNEVIEAEKFCSKIKQRITDDELRLKSVQEEMKTRRMSGAGLSKKDWTNAEANPNSAEHQKLQLLQSRNKVIDLFESSLENTLKDATSEMKLKHRNSWGGFGGLTRTRDFVSSKELIDSVLQSVQTENLDEIAEKEAELLTCHQELSDSEARLRELNEKESTMHNDVFKQLESRKVRSEMSRVRHYRKISQSVDQLLTITEGDDPKNLTQLSNETQFLGKCRERLEDLEKW